MVRSLVATVVQYAVAFLVGLPIFAAFTLAQRLLRRDNPASRPTATGVETLG